jgi:hypothetical protein
MPLMAGLPEPRANVTPGTADGRMGRIVALGAGLSSGRRRGS